MTKNKPPFLTVQHVLAKVQTSEDAWNARNLDAVVLSNTIDCQWRYRVDFLWGREHIRAFLARNWRREFEYRRLHELWDWSGNRIAIRLACEFRNDSGSWFRSYGNENWEFDDTGVARRLLTCTNEHIIAEHERALRWPAGSRPADYPTLSELGF